MKNKYINILLLIIFIILLFNFTNNTNEKFELKYRGNILRNGVVYTKEIIKGVSLIVEVNHNFTT